MLGYAATFVGAGDGSPNVLALGYIGLIDGDPAEYTAARLWLNEETLLVGTDSAGAQPVVHAVLGRNTASCRTAIPCTGGSVPASPTRDGRRSSCRPYPEMQRGAIERED